jgi:hypothetical protein
MRSFEQFERKVIKVGLGYELLESRPPSVGCDQLELLAVYRNGGLHNYYRSEVRDPEQLQAGLERGELVVDARLPALMDTASDSVQESPTVQEGLRHMWTRGEPWADSLHAAQALARERAATIAKLEGQLRDTLAEVSKLAEELSAVRNSRIMRFTAPARGAYYRVRPTKG